MAVTITATTPRLPRDNASYQLAHFIRHTGPVEPRPEPRPSTLFKPREGAFAIPGKLVQTGKRLARANGKKNKPSGDEHLPATVQQKTTAGGARYLQIEPEETSIPSPPSIFSYPPRQSSRLPVHVVVGDIDSNARSLLSSYSFEHRFDDSGVEMETHKSPVHLYDPAGEELTRSKTRQNLASPLSREDITALPNVRPICPAPTKKPTLAERIIAATSGTIGAKPVVTTLTHVRTGSRGILDRPESRSLIDRKQPRRAVKSAGSIDNLLAQCAKKARTTSSPDDADAEKKQFVQDLHQRLADLVAHDKRHSTSSISVSSDHVRISTGTEMVVGQSVRCGDVPVVHVPKRSVTTISTVPSHGEDEAPLARSVDATHASEQTRAPLSVLIPDAIVSKPLDHIDHPSAITYDLDTASASHFSRVSPADPLPTTTYSSTSPLPSSFAHRMARGEHVPKSPATIATATIVENFPTPPIPPASQPIVHTAAKPHAAPSGSTAPVNSPQTTNTRSLESRLAALEDQNAQLLSVLTAMLTNNPTVPCLSQQQHSELLSVLTARHVPLNSTTSPVPASVPHQPKPSTTYPHPMYPASAISEGTGSRYTSRRASGTSLSAHDDPARLCGPIMQPEQLGPSVSRSSSGSTSVTPHHPNEGALPRSDRVSQHSSRAADAVLQHKYSLADDLGPLSWRRSRATSVSPAGVAAGH